MIRYRTEYDPRAGGFKVEVFNGVESGGWLTQKWWDIDELRRDMDLLGVVPVFPPDVQR